MSATQERVPRALHPLYEQIVALMSPACAKHLDSDCEEVAVMLTAALARKRPFPLVQGRSATWAAGILSVVARTNFLYDETQVPHCTPADLASARGVSASAAAGKARIIEDLLLGIVPMDPRWTPANRLRDNPLVWFLEIDGVVLDVRTQPREIQERALQRGLVPFLP